MSPPFDDIDAVDDRIEVRALVGNLKSALPQLERLLEECTGEWGYEDPIYRFYLAAGIFPGVEVDAGRGR